MGYRVLLIDLDPNSNLTLGFGSFLDPPTGFSKDLFLAGRAHSVKCVRTRHKNLDLIPSNEEIASLDGRLSLNSSATLLKIALNAIPAESYDVIVIDCPPSLGFLTINALTASDLLIVPTQSEFFSAYALQNMFSMIADIRKNVNPGLMYRVLVTLLDPHSREHRNILNQLQKHLGNSLYQTRIEVNSDFRESQILGIPITYAMPDSRGTQQYNDLAREIVKGLEKESHDHHNTPQVGPLLEAGAGIDQNTRMSPAFSEIDNSLDQDQVPTAIKPADKKQTFEEGFAGIATKNGQSGVDQYCPFLGGLDDPQTMSLVPSLYNKCHRSRLIVSPIYTHQAAYCISNNYQVCPMLMDKTNKSLPSTLRGPIDMSELMLYVKHWVRTKNM
jgi:chromosome partitioning protein